MKKSRKWHIFVFSLLFSFLLWISVNLGGRYQTFIKIKVESVNLPKGKALMEPLPEYLNVKFYGPGWQLASMYFNPNLKCELDLSVLNKNNFILLKQDFPRTVKLPMNVQPIEIYPDSIFVSLDDYIEKRVPVKPDVIVSCSNGYGVVGDVEINPTYVKISGPKSILKNIDYWKTAFNEYKDVKEKITTIIPLSDTLRGVINLSHEMVGINVEVQMTAEQEYKNIPLILKDFPNDHSITILPSKADVMVRSGVDKLAGFDRNQLKIIIRYKQIQTDSLGYLIPEVNIPKGLKVIRVTPNRFEYIIRK
jgi:YbbR domain-containing protein